MLDRDTERFVGPRADVYAERWATAAVEQARVFHWPAFFLGFLWLSYRKMTGFAFALGALLAIETALENAFRMPVAVSYAVNLALAIVLGFNANGWYAAHVRERIAAIRATHATGEVDDALRRRGGVSIAIAVGLFVALFLVLLIVDALTAPRA